MSWRAGSTPFGSAIVMEHASEKGAAGMRAAGLGEPAAACEQWYRNAEGGASIAIREIDPWAADPAPSRDPSSVVAVQIAFAGKPSRQAFEAPLVFALLFYVPLEELRGFDTWYDTEHVPMLLECPDWLAARRFRIEGTSGGRYNRLVLHYLATEEALQSSARTRSQETPARKAIALRPWFNEGQRLVLRRQ